MEMMKAVRIHEYGGSEVLVYEDAPRPEPGPDDLLVRVRAASVNPVDWNMREGYLRQWVDLPLPATLGSDLAGDVVALGAQVRGFQVGDAVFGLTNMRVGAHAEYAAAPHSELALKPPALDYETAAAAGLSALAAWQALMEMAHLTAGQSVLIHAAAGGVGAFAVQFARLRGARVVGTASRGNVEFVRSLGADDVIDYTTTPFEEVVRDIDVVLDLVGGETQDRSWQVLKPGGVLLAALGLSPTAQQAAAAVGARGEMIVTQPNAGQERQIAELIAAGQVRPVVSMILPLSAARQAYDLSQSRHTRGKIVLRIGDA
jgi:NADPH:quinone reductase-like Zn-dependent oxidoreductase